jgi:hypothetical protein
MWKARVASAASEWLTLKFFQHHATSLLMTVQFSRQAIAAFLHLGKIAKTGSGLVRRLVRARNDPGKERIRKWLIDLDDAQLRSGLGLTLEDIAVLRDGTPQACRTEVYRRERQPENTLGASAADEERLQLYQKSMPGSFRTRTSLRTRPNPVLARLPGETFGID